YVMCIILFRFLLFVFFFFQAEDGIRDYKVTGVQTCALPISFATAGIAEKYRAAEGSVTLQRPGKVYLIVQGPFATGVAQMTSDGEHFRIAILKGDDKYRRFVRGTNNAVYPKLDMDSKSNAGKKDKSSSEAQTVNALSN